MRYNKRITFVTEFEGGYNPETGKNDEPRIEEKTLPCNLSELGITRTSELFGEIDTKIIVARTQRPLNQTFDYALLNGKKYNVKRQSEYRRGVYYLEGAL